MARGDNDSRTNRRNPNRVDWDSPGERQAGEGLKDWLLSPPDMLGDGKVSSCVSSVVGAVWQGGLAGARHLWGHLDTG